MTENKKPSVTKKLSILIVEDSDAGIAFLRQELKGIGFEHIVMAKNGAEGLEKARESARIGVTFELVIADINMPKMDGLQMVEQFKEEDALKNIPVLIKVLKAINLGVQQYIIKPYSRNDLKDKIIAIFNQLGKDPVAEIHTKPGGEE
jgi:YesN/AraC family two-component response regulator